MSYGKTVILVHTPTEYYRDDEIWHGGDKNGLYTYDRKPKFRQETIRGILSRPAAIEKDN